MSAPDRDDDATAPVRRLREALRRLADQTRGRPRTGLTHQDADDVTGTAGTDDAAGFDPLPLLRALDLAGAQVVVIGQVAGIMHGSRELTGDLDLLWDGDPGQAGTMAAAFSSAAPVKWRRSPPGSALVMRRDSACGAHDASGVTSGPRWRRSTPEAGLGT
ncbi:MAG TPA: hypothetical protein VFW50_20450 [Streptosporangiaceae bacterium]|nr:hypothetical protein [Streptosporangiaceae bacterium]